MLVVSGVVMALGLTDIVPRGDAWRAAIIPAYLPVLINAVLATSLSLSGLSAWLLYPVSVALTLSPFAAIDWLVARSARARVRSAATPPPQS